MIIIGYTPLFRPEFLVEKINASDITEIIKKWDEFDSPRPTGVLWTSVDNVTHAIFVIEKAKAVYDHLIEWSEGNYKEWFSYCYKEYDDGYVIALHPNIEKSIERLKTNHLIKYGTELDNDDKIHMIYRTLHCIGTTLKTIKLIENFDHTKIVTGLIDTLDIRAKNYENILRLEGIKYNNKYDQYLDSQYEDYLKNK